MCVCVCVCVCVRACVRACVHACVRACMHACVHVCALMQVWVCVFGCCFVSANGLLADVCQCCCLLMFVCLPLSRHLPCKTWWIKNLNLTWLVNCHLNAFFFCFFVSEQVLCTPCTHAPNYRVILFEATYVGYRCLAITYYLFFGVFFQTDLDLLCALW